MVLCEQKFLTALFTHLYHSHRIPTPLSPYFSRKFQHFSHCYIHVALTSTQSQ